MTSSSWAFTIRPLDVERYLKWILKIKRFCWSFGVYKIKKAEEFVWLKVLISLTIDANLNIDFVLDNPVIEKGYITSRQSFRCNFIEPSVSVAIQAKPQVNATYLIVIVRAKFRPSWCSGTESDCKHPGCSKLDLHSGKW